jgi:hypothetical protein
VTLKKLLIAHAAAGSQPPSDLSRILNVSTGSLYRWLDARNQFPRPVIGFPDYDITRVGERLSSWCRHCGLTIQEHAHRDPVYLAEARASVYGSGQFDIDSVPIYFGPCKATQRLPDFPRPPAVSIQPWFSSIVEAPSNLIHTSYNDVVQVVSEHDVVRLTDPLLIRWIQKTIAPLTLPSFEALAFDHLDESYTPGSGSPVGGVISPSDREHPIAPYALLGQCLRIFVKEVVAAGVRSAMKMTDQIRSWRPQDMDVALAGSQDYSTYLDIPGDSGIFPRQVLTPTHILDGLSNSAHRIAHRHACIGRLGVGSDGLLIPRAPTSAALLSAHNITSI